MTSTWNPSDKSANITLTSSNTVAQSSNTTDGAVRSTGSQATSSGKWYFECLLGAGGTSGSNTGCGIVTSAQALNTIGPTPSNAFIYYISGGIWYQNSNVFNSDTIANRPVGFAIDLVNNKAWARFVPSGNWNGSGTANPATGVGGQDISAVFGSHAAFIVATFNVSNVSTAIRTQAAQFTGAIPSGFSAWDLSGPQPGEADLTLSAVAPSLNLGISPPSAALTLTEAAPIVYPIHPPAAALTLTEAGPTIDPTFITTANLALTEAAPSLGLLVTPGVASLTLTEAAPRLNLGISPPAASLTLTEAPPFHGEVIFPPVARLTLTEAAPLVTTEFVIRPPSASLTLQAVAPKANVHFTIPGPYFFAWVDSDETVFSPAHWRYDEIILRAEFDLAEGDFPSLTVEMRNPHVGFLSTGRKQWVWFSKFNFLTNQVEPIFFGRLDALPQNPIAEVITVKFIARSLDYLEQLQKLAETLKTRPNYDPVFVTQSKQDDPKTILEGWSAFYNVHPRTLQVTLSDILVGEEGLVDFTGHGDAFYDSLQIEIDQNAKTVVRMDAQVGWTQTMLGTIDMGVNHFMSYSWDGILHQWFTPEQDLGGGWSVFDATAVDRYGLERTITANWSKHYQNTEKTHQDGDTMSVDESQTIPVFQGPFLSYDVTVFQQVGLLDPAAVDDLGNPAPINNPAITNITTMYVPLGQIDTTLILKYQPQRQRTERLTFTMTSDLQAILIDPTVEQDSEILSLSGVDVGVELLNVLNWLSVEDSNVSVGQVIAPDIGRSLPQGTSYQICTTPGHTGTSEPTFSDIPGAQTLDGGVVWTSLGTTNLLEPPDWAPQTVTPVGKLIIPLPRLFEYYSTLVEAGEQQFPPIGTGVSLFQIVQSQGTFQICTLAGITDPFHNPPPFSGAYGSILIDGTVRWESLGTQLPQGTAVFICIGGGTTGVIPPNFSYGVGNLTVDNGVVWMSLGLAASFIGIPIGGVPGNVPRRSYFPTDRGLWSVEHLIARCRAYLRMQARAAKVQWDCPYERAVALTTRMNARLFDGRIPGGNALGKVIAVKAIVDGDQNLEIGHVTIGAAVGHAQAVENVLGVPTYVQEGYFNPGEVQYYSGSTIVLPISDDIGYTPPADEPADDGLVFPLTKQEVVVVEQVHGDLGSQAAGIQSAFLTARQVALLELGVPVAGLPVIGPPRSVSQSVALQQRVAILGVNTVEHQLLLNPIWYDLQLKPVDSGPFETDYEITVTPLQTPKQYDLEAPSS